jgi:hypothetical protein
MDAKDPEFYVWKEAASAELRQSLEGKTEDEQLAALQEVDRRMLEWRNA